MRALNYIFSPPVIGLLALLLSIVWMMRDQKDKTRAVLVIALVINLFYGITLNLVMAKESGLFPWKYDHVLAKLDEALGCSAAMIAPHLQAAWRIPLVVIYQLMVPMMIGWYMAVRRQGMGGAIVLAYIGEMLAGPLLYAILPACGPVYVFRSGWLHPSPVQAEVIRASGMPNAFPSLHVATAVVFMFFARGRLMRGVALGIAAATVLATLSTGEHYLIDMVPGMIFGCYAASVGYRRFQEAAVYLGITLTWSLLVRFKFQAMIDHPIDLRIGVMITLLAAAAAIALEWRRPSLASELAPLCRPA